MEEFDGMALLEEALNNSVQSNEIVNTENTIEDPTEFATTEEIEDFISFLKDENWSLVSEKILTEDEIILTIAFTGFGEPVSKKIKVNRNFCDKIKENTREEHILVKSSGSAEVDETTSRFSGAIWYEQIQKKNITLAGVGGIGSYVGFLLGRFKPAFLYLYDDDIVEAANMSGQFYCNSDIGEYKVDALKKMLRDYANYYNVLANSERYTENSTATDIMICGFDNMIARQTVFNNWEKHIAELSEERKAQCLLIDGRLAAEEFQVLALQGNDERAIREYKEDWLFNDSEAEETICSYKQTTFMANMIASTMINIFVNFVANECNPIIDRDVPFITSYSADTMYFKVIL